MRFLIDNQLPPALARFMQSDLKAESMHVVELGLRDASDAEIWRYASEHNLILISKDEDFAHVVLQTPTARLIWVRIGNCRRDFLLDLFRRIWPRLMERLESGDRFIEVR